MEAIKQIYHFLLPYLGALVYGFPSNDMLVIGVTGTKGKSSTTEMVNTILESAGYRTAVLNSIRIKVGDETKLNTMRMSMPGRFFIQRFLYRALHAGCNAVVLEMTSQGATQYRHRAIAMDALIFTNLAPEHIESHGSYEAYADAKFEIAKQLIRSHKRPRIMVFNADDAQAPRYLGLPTEKSAPFSLSADTTHTSDDSHGRFTFDGTTIELQLSGEFSIANALAAATLAHELGIDTPTIRTALESITRIPGRAERIGAGQDFPVVVDYAHTPDSLQAIYDAYKNHYRICVLGSTGGGRDMWKRPVMGRIADENCDVVILTNEDPYDEDPMSIVEGLKRGMKREPTIIMDRREAIAHALSLAVAQRPAGTQDSASTHRAQQNPVFQPAVLITGKGTDPNIAGPRGTKISWSDADVAREEINKLLQKK